MRIFLVGLSGSGKSSLAKKLAHKIELACVDLDEEIEHSCAESIESLIKGRGEPYFRQIESDTLKYWLAKDNYVMACGGGTPCFFKNLELMKNNGCIIYLQLPIKALISRLKSSYDRPLLSNARSDSELESLLENQLQERSRYYEQAHFTIPGLSLNSEAIQTLVQKINDYYTK